MNYIQIYENFINNRLKLLNDIILNDNKMLDMILDLVPDTLEILDYDFGNKDTLDHLDRNGYHRDDFIKSGLNQIIQNLPHILLLF